jgi:hypothetical protein
MLFDAEEGDAFSDDNKDCQSLYDVNDLGLLHYFQ